MRVSIAMATFNGARFLADQLQSFLRQTHAPAELVVSDDASTDGTVELVEAFARQAPFTVTVHRNAETLGYAANFGRALELCSGDLVLLSDQDDVWFDWKIERIVSLAEATTDLLFVHDLAYTDDQLRPLGMTALSQCAQEGRSASTLHNGCATAVRSELLGIALPIPQITGHDNWLHAVAGALGGKRIVPEVLVYYRMHGSNASHKSGQRNMSVAGSAIGAMARRIRVSVEKSSCHVVRGRRRFAEELLDRLNRAAVAPGAVLDVSAAKVGDSIEVLRRDIERYRLREHAMSRRGLLLRLLAVIDAWRQGAYAGVRGGLLRGLVDDALRP